ncbi:MAG: hypothetical protein U0228_22555 [Myxococcaceae bacterium]
MRVFTTLLLLLAGTAFACPWDYETFAAETGALPCLGALAAGVYPSHSPEYLARKLAMTEWQLAFAPRAPAVLDARVVTLLALKKPAEAVTVARARLALEPDAYESHSNLATALTFSGELDEALKEVDAALAKNPQAHFGRETAHRQLLVYLLKLKTDATLATREDFLGRKVGVASPHGERDALELEALISMISVYGAADVAHLWVALGDLALSVDAPRIAWAAFNRAVTLKHPAPLKAALDAAERRAREQWKPSPMIASVLEIQPDGGIAGGEGGWAGMARSVAQEESKYKARWDAYVKSEKQLLAAGLTYWNAAGATALYARQVSVGLRCPASSQSAAAPPTGATENTVYLRLGELSREASCARAAEILDRALGADEGEALRLRARVGVINEGELDALSELFARCGEKLVAVRTRARALTTDSR